MRERTYELKVLNLKTSRILGWVIKEEEPKYAVEAGLFIYGKQNNKPHMLKCHQSWKKKKKVWFIKDGVITTFKNTGSWVRDDREGSLILKPKDW